MNRPFPLEHDRLLGLASVMAMALIPVPLVLLVPDAIKNGWDFMVGSNVLSEVFGANSSLSNSVEVTNEHAVLDPEPLKYVYYYCGGLDVSAGGTIDCGTGVRDDGDVKEDGNFAEDGDDKDYVDVGATEAGGYGHATPYPTTRFSVATTEREEEVALARKQAMPQSELFSPSFAIDEHDPDTSHTSTNKHDDTSHVGSNEHPDSSLGYVEETSQAAQTDATLVFVQKGPSSPATTSPTTNGAWGHVTVSEEDDRVDSREASDGVVEQADRSSGVDAAPPFTVVPETMVQAGLSSRFDGAPSIITATESSVQAGSLPVTAGVNPVACVGEVVQAGSPSEAADVNPVAVEKDVAALSSAGEDVAALPSAGEDVASFASPGKRNDKPSDAQKASFSYMADLVHPKAVVLAEEKPEENESQALFSQTTDGMGRPEKTENQASFLPTTQGVESLQKSPLVKGLLACSKGEPKADELSTTTEALPLIVTDVPIDPVTATTTTPGVSGNISAKPEPDELLGGKGESEEPGTTPSVPGNDRFMESAGAVTTLSAPDRDQSMDLDLDLESAAMSKERVSVVQPSKTQRLPVAPEYPLSTPSNSSAITLDSAAPNSDRSMGLTNAVTSEEVISVPISAKTQGLSVAPEHPASTLVHPVSTPFDSAVVVDTSVSNSNRSMGLQNATTSEELVSAATSAKTQGLPLASDEHSVSAPSDDLIAIATDLSKGGTSTATAREEQPTTVTEGSQVLGAVEVEEAALVSDGDSKRKVDATPGTSPATGTKEPTKEATPVAESDARSDLDSLSAGNASPEAGSEVLGTVEEAALGSQWDFLRLRRRASMERLSPTSTHPAHYWTAEETDRRYPIPIELLESMCRRGGLWYRSFPECDRLL